MHSIIIGAPRIAYLVALRAVYKAYSILSSAERIAYSGAPSITKSVAYLYGG